MEKLSIEGLEGKALETVQKINAQIDALAAIEQKQNASAKEYETIINKIAEIEEKGYENQILKLKNAILEMERKNPVTPKNSEQLSMRDEIVAEIKSLGVNNVKELVAYLQKNGKQDFEIKAISAIATTANSDTVGRTNLDMRVAWTPTTKNAFLGRFRTVAESSNKSKFGYTEGTYTSAAAYVGEGAGNSTSDSATASAVFMDYAKVQAVLSVNTEVYEDLPDFADGLLAQMQIATSKFVDGEAYTGDGLAPASVQHIKGLKTYAKEAEFTSGKNMVAYAASVKLANVADLASAVKSHIDNLDGQYNADLCYMSPVDFFKMSHLKDTTGQPLFGKDMFGNPTLAGMQVITSNKITANTMLILDSNVPEWRTKRSWQLKVGQILANDALNDKQSAILMARYQLLVRNADQNAIIKVSDIGAAVTAITLA